MNRSRVAFIAFAISISVVAGKSSSQIRLQNDGLDAVNSPNYPILTLPVVGHQGTANLPPTTLPSNDVSMVAPLLYNNDVAIGMVAPLPYNNDVANTVGVAGSIVPPVRLGLAGQFAILSKAGISSVPSSVITGHIGVSPIAGTAITGFSPTADSSNTYATSPQVTGRVYAADYASPTPSMMTSAILDMQTAYTDAASRPISNLMNLNVKSGLISGSTFEAGVFKWGSDINFGSDVYIRGNKDSHYIFQSTGNVIVGSGAKVILIPDGSGTAPLPENIVWQMAGYISVGTSAHLEGIFLTKTKAVFKTGASLNGRVLSQTACTLDAATITQP